LAIRSKSGNPDRSRSGNAARPSAYVAAWGQKPLEPTVRNRHCATHHHFQERFAMTTQKRFVLHIGLVFLTFVLAATFPWVLPFHSGIFVAVSAISLLGVSATWIRVEKHMRGGGMAITAFLSVVSAFVFGALFMSWTATIVFILAAFAFNLIGSTVLQEN